MTELASFLDFDQLADDDLDGAVAIHLTEALMPAEGHGAPIFPPTYTDVGYNIDELPDGTKLATIDSVGSQANRIEPMFRRSEPGRRENPCAALVPQVEIAYRVKDEDGDEERSVSILDAGHRLGDALIRGTELAKEAHDAFALFLRRGDSTQIAKLAPTSLVFGVWDSRDTQAKLPRIVSSVVRAHDVAKITRSAQFTPAIDYAQAGVVSQSDQEKAVGKASSDLAQRGYVHIPSTGQLGGVIARGDIRRDVTVNLVALRRLDGENGKDLRRYVLGLALVAATAPQDGFLRSGCQLTPDPERPATWTVVERNGVRRTVALDRKAVLEYAAAAAKAFGVGEDRNVQFDLKRAKSDVTKKKKKDPAEAKDAEDAKAAA
jgi:CRISPR-associated protein Csb1